MDLLKTNKSAIENIYALFNYALPFFKTKVDN